MIRLLIVEDDSTLLYIIKSGLQEVIGGYEVTTATNGAEGLKVWEEHRPDVILSDIDMPVMNGYEMVERIRETDGDIPILFASAMSSPKDVTKGYELGVNNYVKKPFTADELDAHIKALVKMKEGTKSRNETDHCRMGRLLLDAKHATLRNDETGEIQVLSVREAQFMQLLYQNRGEVVKRSAILSRFWETEDDYFASRSMDVFVNKMRKYLSAEPCVEIKTVRGVGLMMLLN